LHLQLPLFFVKKTKHQPTLKAESALGVAVQRFHIRKWGN